VASLFFFLPHTPTALFVVDSARKSPQWSTRNPVFYHCELLCLVCGCFRWKVWRMSGI